MNLRNITNVSICQGSMVNKTIKAMEYSSSHVQFKKYVVVTEEKVDHDWIEIISIGTKIDLSTYNQICVSDLHKYFDTDFCIVSQWDGFVIDGSRWKDYFLDYDYIGAPWGYKINQSVGNGGFSLRSRKFVEVSRKFTYTPNESKWLFPQQKNCFKYVPEDWFLCYNKMEEMEKENIKFPDREIAYKFSVEHPDGKHPFNRDNVKTYKSFGFHGEFNTGGMELLNDRSK